MSRSSLRGYPSLRVRRSRLLPSLALHRLRCWDFVWDRAQLEIHASGRISEIYGAEFACQDGYLRQVRMPEPPLLLADRVIGMDAEPGSMAQGTIWTETDRRTASKRPQKVCCCSRATNCTIKPRAAKAKLTSTAAAPLPTTVPSSDAQVRDAGRRIAHNGQAHGHVTIATALLGGHRF